MKNKVQCPECKHEFEHTLNLMQATIDEYKRVLNQPPEYFDNIVKCLIEEQKKPTDIENTIINAVVKEINDMQDMCIKDLESENEPN